MSGRERCLEVTLLEEPRQSHHIGRRGAAHGSEADTGPGRGQKPFPGFPAED